MNYECAKCGVSVGNGGIDLCSIVNDLDPQEGNTILTLRFCRDREEDGKKVRGCTKKVLNENHLTHWRESHGAH